MLELLENSSDAATLVRAAQRGSAEAFQQLARGYDHPVLSLALRITTSEQDAQTIHRETFLNLHRTLGSIDSDTAICLGVYRIAALLCLDYLRKPRAKASSRPLLDTLSPHERLVLELKHYDGLKLRTVSEILNTTEETARDILVRATRKLH